MAAAIAIGIAFGSSASAATLPSGFRDTVVFSGLTNPTNVRFASDGRGLRGREERHDQGLRQPRPTPRPRSSRTCAPRSTTTGTAGCSAWRCDPQLPDRALRLRRSTPTTPRSAGPPPVLERRLPRPAGPDHRRLRGQRAPVAAHRRAATATRAAEQVLITDWCQQFPSHSIGDLEFGPDGTLYVERRRRRELQLRRLRPAAASRTPAATRPAAAGTN